MALSNVALILDIDGVIRDVFGSYHRALADTVEHFTQINFDKSYRPSSEDIDLLKTEGIWNNDWEAAQELIKRHAAKTRIAIDVDYKAIVEFFQSRYRGSGSSNWTGYITSEPLIATPEYFQELTASGISWGFFSGATRASATYVLNRLDIYDPILVAMEDAAGKPDPTGLWKASKSLGDRPIIIYAGDTAADMLTVRNAKERDPKNQQKYIAVGVLPPHVHNRNPEEYTQMLIANGADLVLKSILELDPKAIAALI